MDDDWKSPVDQAARIWEAKYEMARSRVAELERDLAFARARIAQQERNPQVTWDGRLMEALDVCAESDRRQERIRTLESRNQELLETVARISRETPYPDELKGWEAQRGAMLAEVGTLRSRVAELEQAAIANETRAKQIARELQMQTAFYKCYWQATQDEVGQGAGPSDIGNLIDQLRGERDALKKQLPDGMEHCTILCKACPRGHHWLTAKNWVQHGCPTCESQKLEAKLADWRRWADAIADQPEYEKLGDQSARDQIAFRLQRAEERLGEEITASNDANEALAAADRLISALNVDNVLVRKSEVELLDRCRKLEADLNMAVTSDIQGGERQAKNTSALDKALIETLTKELEQSKKHAELLATELRVTHGEKNAILADIDSSKTDLGEMYLEDVPRYLAFWRSSDLKWVKWADSLVQHPDPLTSYGHDQQREAIGTELAMLREWKADDERGWSSCPKCGETFDSYKKWRAANPPCSRCGCRGPHGCMGKMPEQRTADEIKDLHKRLQRALSCNCVSTTLEFFRMGETKATPCVLHGFDNVEQLIRGAAIFPEGYVASMNAKLLEAERTAQMEQGWRKTAQEDLSVMGRMRDEALKQLKKNAADQEALDKEARVRALQEAADVCETVDSTPGVFEVTLGDPCTCRRNILALKEKP